mmetsp:Transcript_50660/g.101818  ORF Transcript_50660/g.101818 Transcript_50660/m.101818 type:complete len:176 (+) Transcript_50660:88-615(+)
MPRRNNLAVHSHSESLVTVTMTVFSFIMQKSMLISAPNCFELASTLPASLPLSLPEPTCHSLPLLDLAAGLAVGLAVGRRPSTAAAPAATAQAGEQRKPHGQPRHRKLTLEAPQEPERRPDVPEVQDEGVRGHQAERRDRSIWKPLIREVGGPVLHVDGHLEWVHLVDRRPPAIA